MRSADVCGRVHVHGRRKELREGAGRGWLAAAIAIDLANLAFFKYTLFFLGTLADLGLELAGPRDWVGANVILPVGISFYTFQLIALLVDSYRGGSPRAVAAFRAARPVARPRRSTAIA